MPECNTATHICYDTEMLLNMPPCRRVLPSYTGSRCVSVLGRMMCCGDVRIDPFWCQTSCSCGMSLDCHSGVSEFNFLCSQIKIFTYTKYKNYQRFLFTNQRTTDCLKNNIKIYIKIAPTCFSAVTPSSGSALSVLAKVTFC